VENGDERFWKEKFHAANGKAQHALMNYTIFFLFEEWVGEKYFLFFPLIFEEWMGEKDFLFFPLIFEEWVGEKDFLLFPLIPHDVPNGNTSVLSHMVCPKFNSHVYKLQRWNVGASTFVSILQVGVQKRCFNWGMPNVPKKLADGPINMAPLKKKMKKSCECTHELYN